MGVVKADDLIEALKDASVAESIANALGPFLAKAIDTAITRKLNDLHSEIDVLRAQVVDQGRRLEEMEVYSRAHDIIIRGLPDSSYSEVASSSSNMDVVMSAESHTSVVNSVLNLFNNKMSVSVEPRDISVAHRLKASKNDRFRPVIVRFTSRKIRDEVLHSKKKLYTPRGGGEEKGRSIDDIYISEHLTKSASNLFFEARKLLREKSISAAWTRNGFVNIKFTRNIEEKPTIVKSHADFVRPRS